jgi:hypothetical protein
LIDERKLLARKKLPHKREEPTGADEDPISRSSSPDCDHDAKVGYHGNDIVSCHDNRIKIPPK